MKTVEARDVGRVAGDRPAGVFMGEGRTQPGTSTPAALPERRSLTASYAPISTDIRSSLGDVSTPAVPRRPLVRGLSLLERDGTDGIDHTVRMAEFSVLSIHEQIVRASMEPDPSLADKMKRQAVMAVLEGSDDNRKGVSIVGYGPQTHELRPTWNPVSSRYTLEIALVDGTSITVPGPSLLAGTLGDLGREANRLTGLVENYGELRSVITHSSGGFQV